MRAVSRSIRGRMSCSSSRPKAPGSWPRPVSSGPPQRTCARFAAFLLDGDDRVLPAKTLAEMRTPAAPPGDDAWASGYGLGLQLFRHDGRVFYGHSGSMPGFLATLCVSPADAIGGIALANATSALTSPRSPSTW